LNDEKIDVIEWNPDPAIYIAKGISPARVTGVYLNETLTGPKTATVVVPEDQLSLAIGRNGQNARLAAKLTGWRIDIKSLPEATSELLFKLENNPEYTIFRKQEEETIPQIEAIMAKKEEGRPIPPEEYHLMGSFVDRIEQGVIQRRQAIKKEHESRLIAAQDAVPEAVYDLPVFALGLSEEITTRLNEEEYENIGDLMVQYFFDPTPLIELEGIDEDVLEEVNNAFTVLTSSLPEPETEVPAEEVQPDSTEEEPELEPARSAEEEKAESEEVLLDEEIDEVVVEEAVGELPEESQAEKEPQVEEELPKTFEEIFKLKPEMLDLPEDGEEEDPQAKKKKRKRYVDVEYDPDQDVTIFRKKRKKEIEDWEDWEDDWE
jgi:N utilization substance protein A